MNLANVNNKLRSGKWLMSKASLWSLYEDVNRLSELRLGGLYGKVFGNPIMLSTQTDIVPSQETEGVGDVAIIGINGTLVKGATDAEEQVLGWVNTDKIGEALDKVAEEDSVKSIVLNIASGGGEITGIPELGRKIKAVDAVKPVYAWTEFNAQSAAYWLASQARYMGMTPSAEVGSIGVYVLRMDISKKLEKDGITPNFIHSGDYKMMQNEALSLQDTERKLIFDDVVKSHDQFKAVISASRPKANGEAMEGLSYGGDDALANNLVDVVTDNFSTFLDYIAKQ
jgi:capsid assembly protease